jgi:hypothetical protein
MRLAVMVRQETTVAGSPSGTLATTTTMKALMKTCGGSGRGRAEDERGQERDGQ